MNLKRKITGIELITYEDLYNLDREMLIKLCLSLGEILNLYKRGKNV